MSDVLIVEDDADSSGALSNLLKREGHVVRCCYNGKDALEAVLAEAPEVIVLDLAMPEMDGVSLLHVLRSYLRLQKLPVVVWTGLGESEMVDEARAMNINSIVLKGRSTYEDVLSAIRNTLRMSATPGNH